LMTAIAAQAQTFQVIHTFSGGGDGGFPNAGLTPDGAGNFYGTTTGGGPHEAGVVFSLSHLGSGWVLSPLHSFTGGQNDGREPYSRAVIGPDGALYGNTSAGGPSDGGTIYRLTPPTSICRSTLCSWTETVLHNFPDPLGTDGFYPYGDLAFDQVGNIYGTASVGGSENPYGCYGEGCGVVYQMVRSQGSWTENIVHEFTGGSDGGVPYSGVLLDPAGNIDGTACEGGSHGYGLALRISASGWVESAIYNFQGYQDGMCPLGIILDQSGNLCGTSGNSGPYGDGAVYELSPENGGWNFALLYRSLREMGPRPLSLETAQAISTAQRRRAAPTAMEPSSS
ncbi:MAG: choice-of-anchor tandem repeat GloVer-containing protein, partial [Candidatus Korobacteraceae bacterium]